MSENDYVAEYVREKHPSLLGADYALWKIGKIGADFVVQFIGAIKNIDWPQALQAAESKDEEQDEDEPEVGKWQVTMDSDYIVCTKCNKVNHIYKVAGGYKTPRYCNWCGDDKGGDFGE